MNRRFLALISALCMMSPEMAAADTAAAAYNPPWAGSLSWAANNSLFARPPMGSFAYLDNNSVDSNYLPWWQMNVPHPILNYDASVLPTGMARLDSALMAEITFHRLLRGWSKQTSPTGIDNVYTFTPGGHNQEDQTARAGQTAFFDLGLHPTQSISADIGAEVIGNYDQRYWFPVNDEHRMHKDDHKAKIVRGEVKYDNGTVLLRGFEGTPIYGAWMGQNDLFRLLPTQDDIEYYRRINGSIAPRGGEMRVKTPFGILNVLGGAEPRWTYGPSVYARYEAPVFRNLEQSLVYRNENIPFGFEDPDERRWALSYNASYPISERVAAHSGLMYQPFRLGRAYQDVDSDNTISIRRSERSDAFGWLIRTEVKPTSVVDLAGLGYQYRGPVAGNKHQLDVDAARTLWTDWTFSGAYIYRQPVQGPVPLIFEGTTANPGALLAQPRGPDDPFRVEWDNRKAHIFGFTLAYDPTPGTPFYMQQRDVLEDWNMNPDEDSTWTAALQYRLTHYLTNTDRLYYYDEERNLIFDPTFHSGALATSHPFSSATGLVRWKVDQWRVTGDLSGGQALAGAAIAYTPATTFYKPSTTFMSGGITATNGFLKAFFRYSQDVWGPFDYATQLGWTYHKMYQAGLSYIVLRDAELGFRYTGTRMTNEFIGSDMGAFNEYKFYFSYHFTWQRDFSSKFEAIGRPLPQSFPDVHVALSDTFFTPDGSGAARNILIYPQASADAGILSWKLMIRNVNGETVRKWDGNGVPPKTKQWEGAGSDGKTLPAGTYSILLNVVDLYGNEATSPAPTVEIRSAARVPEPPVTAPAPPAPSSSYKLENTAEGLRVTLSSLILFEVGKYNLRNSAKEGLDQVIELLKAYPSNTLRIVGHTDATGSQATNQALSERRAGAVRDYLVEKGKIDSTRIKTIGYGKDRPVASNVLEEGRQQNRRVEIDILK